MQESLLSASFMLFLILDPFGNVPLAASLLRTVPPERRRRVVLRECLIAFAVLLAFLLFGAPLMAFMQLSETSIGIAGGVVLLLIALRMIFPSGPNIFGDEVGGEPLIVPLAIPAIAGPSSMAMVMLLASREPDRLWEWMGALTLATAASTLVLVSGGKLISLMGERGTSAMERLAGLILTTIAVEMLLRGIRTFVGTL